MDHSMIDWQFEGSYARLPSCFFTPSTPVPVRAPELVLFNEALAAFLGFNPEALRTKGLPVFAGNSVAPGSTPLAQAYAGHQFGHFTNLGDGRAILLGERLASNGKAYDIQLKGSGRNPYSRRGDGRAALGPMLREYIVSEAMHALGVPSTRSLAVVATGEMVQREEPRPGGILTRVAASHIRVGTFEYAARQTPADVKALADYAIARHDPELAQGANPYLAFLKAVIRRQASLVAKWQSLGFIHGVMNTDNMAVSGETIDYGPCAFMDHFDPATVFSSIDRGGRYAYMNQPTIALWNLARLGECLLGLIDREGERAIAMANEALQSFPELFGAAWHEEMSAKLGLTTNDAGDATLIESLVRCLEVGHLDFTGTLRALSQPFQEHHPLFQVPGFKEWHGAWQARIKGQGVPPGEVYAAMAARNPIYIPRNHLVEQALNAAVEHSRFGPVRELLLVLAHPFTEQTGRSAYALPAEPHERVQETFCGT